MVAPASSVAQSNTVMDSVVTSVSTSGVVAAPLDVMFVPDMPDRLVTWASDIKLYRIVSRPQDLPYGGLLDLTDSSVSATKHAIRISPRLVAELEGHIQEPPHYVKCVALHPKCTSAADVRVAVGQANGRIALLSFLSGDTSGDAVGSHIVKEFTPKSLRPINGLAWNAVHSHLLAGGYDKSRSDAPVLIFDVERGGLSAAALPLPTGGAGAARHVAAAARDPDAIFVRPVVELGGAGETCNSLAWWQHQNPNILVAGLSSKTLKLFDVRMDLPRLTGVSDSGGGRASASTFTRAVNNVCVDPFLEYRVASVFENSVIIWDTRNFEKPVVTVSSAKPNRITKLAWSPTRSGLLCSTTESCSDLHIYEIQSWAVVIEDGEAAVTERTVKGRLGPKGQLMQDDFRESAAEALSSFVWHPTEKNRIIAVTASGALGEVEVTERMAPAWSADRELMWTRGGRLNYFDKESSLLEDIGDISLKMRRRAESGYGACADLAHNAQFLDGDDFVSIAWLWLAYCRRLMQEQAFKSKFDSGARFPGVRSALALKEQPSILADSVFIAWKGLGGATTAAEGESAASVAKPRRIFRNDTRERAQRLCGWSMHTNDLQLFVAACEAKKEFTRAAAVSVFCLDVQTALLVLERGSKSLAQTSPAEAAAINMTAISLAGFNDDKFGLWKSTVRSFLSQIVDPYLKAMFAFLLASVEEDGIGSVDYSAILDQQGMRLADKLAFACSYLSDEKLSAVVEASWKEVKEKGDIGGGLLICGMNEEAMALMQRYVDVSGDVQTVCWLTVRCLPVNLALGEKPQLWMDCYRNLLDSWQLWTSRAEFDVAVNEATMNCKPPQQVYVSCAYCGVGMAQNLRGIPRGVDARNLAALRQASSHTIKHVRVQMCSSCRRPLPKCAICLITMGSYSGRRIQEHPPKSSATKMTPFDNFFTCR